MKTEGYRQIVEEIKQPMFWWSSFVLVLWKILIYHRRKEINQHRYISVTGYGQSGDKKRCRRP
jgi:hypothetical protein